MILVDESNESQKVQTVKKILINMGIFIFCDVRNITHGSISEIINCAVHTPYLEKLG